MPKEELGANMTEHLKQTYSHHVSPENDSNTQEFRIILTVIYDHKPDKKIIGCSLESRMHAEVNAFATANKGSLLDDARMLLISCEEHEATEFFNNSKAYEYLVNHR